MAAFQKFDQFVEDLAKKVHNLDTDTLKIMLTNVAPVATNTILANLTEITAQNGYAAGGSALTGQDAEQVSGTLTLSANDLVFTASGGSFGPWQYAVLYNSTAAGGPLIGWWDYGSSQTTLTGETLTLDFTTSILTIT